MKRVGLYIRVSTEEQARIQDGSLVSQRRRLEEYVEGQNRREASWGTIIDVYCDEGKSAKDMNRPEFQRLLNDIRIGKINLVLSTELSRMSRSIRDFCELWDIFKDNKASFITLREQFDTTTAAGEMMVFNLINFAQFERKQTGERISANFKSRAQRGLWNGGQLPLGYDRDPKNTGRLILNKTEARTVKAIFDTFQKTGNLNDTCRKLNVLGFRTKQYTNRNGETKGGNHFTVQSLHHLLTNATFIGMREINKKRGDTERVKAQWPAIIDAKVFSAVQKRLTQNLRRYKPDEWKTYAYPLSGLAVCGECGQTLNGKSAHGKNAKHFYYDHARTLKSSGSGHSHTCRIQRLRAGKVEDLVLAAMKTLLSDPKRIEAAISAYRKHSKKESPTLLTAVKALSEEIKALEKVEVNLVNRIAELPAKISAEPIYKKLKEIQEKLSAKKLSKTNLEMDLHKHESSGVTRDDLLLRIQRTVAALEKAPKEDQKAIFTSVLQFAEFHPTKIRLGVLSQDDGRTNPSAKGSAIRGAFGSNSNFSNFRATGCSTTIKIGGGGEIRTRDGLATIPVFKTGVFNHSTTPPQG